MVLHKKNGTDSDFRNEFYALKNVGVHMYGIGMQPVCLVKGKC
jgi:hypothetical protein